MTGNDYFVFFVFHFNHWISPHKESTTPKGSAFIIIIIIHSSLSYRVPTCSNAMKNTPNAADSGTIQHRCHALIIFPPSVTQQQQPADGTNYKTPENVHGLFSL